MTGFTEPRNIISFFYEFLVFKSRDVVAFDMYPFVTITTQNTFIIFFYIFKIAKDPLANGMFGHYQNGLRNATPLINEDSLFLKPCSLLIK